MKRDVELLGREPVYEGYFRIDRYRVRHRLHAGGMSAPIVREVFERGHVAAVLPVDPARRRVVLIEQFRIGPYAAGWEPWLLECVAGIIEPGESPEDVCRREALEEAGCELGELVPVARFITSPGACTETVALYCGRVDSEGVGGVHGLDAEGEDIRAVALGVDEAIGLVESGRVVNAKTIIALQWLALEWDSLARRWG